MNQSIDNIASQGIGGVVDRINGIRIDQLLENLQYQDLNLTGAMEELQKARDFLGSPEHILGSAKTKHGEVAEVFDVRFGNADRIIRGEDPNFIIDEVHRTGPVDYLKDNLPVQSKFAQHYKSLTAVINHLKDYPDFVESGGTYCIPKDYFEQIEAWLNLSSEELSRLPASEGGRLARNVVAKVRELEKLTGKSFSELVSSSQLNYDQVQLNHAGSTIDDKEKEILEVDQNEREKYWEMSRASVEEGLKTAGIAAVISAVLSFATSLISILKQKNKKLSDLNEDDWKTIFKETGIGAIKGGISGGAIYTLTNVANMSAPFAAALVSATLGVATQAIRLYRNEIEYDDFMVSILDVATGSAVSGVGAFVGQMLIPVPGLGAIVGSIVTTTILDATKKRLSGGGFYELVKQAQYEKQFSDAYKPLIVAFENSSRAWEYSKAEIALELRPYIRESEHDFDERMRELHNKIERM